MNRARSTSRPGIALLTALVVVLLLTMFMSELFFATGLELRSLEAYKDSTQARTLARSVLKATEIGLLEDEAEFFSGYRQLQQMMTLASIPVEDGLLVTLDIVPVDSRFNLNELAGLQDNSAQLLARFEVFQNLMAQIPIPAKNPSAPPTQIPEAQVSGIFAALVDWMDTDDVVYTAPDGTPGAEAPAYYGTDPEYVPKNGLLDRLEEIRLVRGFGDANIPWAQFEKRFTVRAKSTKNELYPEKLDANVASRDDIISFLQAHAITNSTVLSDATFGTVQKELNKYADSAIDIANALVPDGTERPVYTDALIKSTLNSAGVNGNVAPQVFASYSQYYRVSIITEVNDIQARLTTLVYVNRNASDRTGKTAEVLQYYME